MSSYLPVKLLLQQDARVNKILDAQIPGLRHDPPSCMAISGLGDLCCTKLAGAFESASRFSRVPAR